MTASFLSKLAIDVSGECNLSKRRTWYTRDIKHGKQENSHQNVKHCRRCIADLHCVPCATFCPNTEAFRVNRSLGGVNAWARRGVNAIVLKAPKNYPPRLGNTCLHVVAPGTTHSATQHNTTQHNTTQHSTTQRNATLHNATQHNTTQHNITQHNTTRQKKHAHHIQLAFLW